uniref:Alpha 1,4-glycosyltransferase domain-containing protein n=1 Tax=Chromera velia CCMP2878 TaxID=1169474 RepID=A0A0G4F6P8_9ALVE|eukprot:Cvel_15479.t1-p1 / transcript=Cvel_15479.t1 / gene=Cvel_15479 / organism=Chromera_velia_CCMP2878 / gene_product=hypothetical protein / transcript_product=hypothetical protein / location=Cvel_scaffold1148:11444-13411(+) / protein_length=376 / sequence_SO=supercontig / SO=protein_coding / is_pseudo=false
MPVSASPGGGLLVQVSSLASALFGGGKGGNLNGEQIPQFIPTRLIFTHEHNMILHPEKFPEALVRNLNQTINLHPGFDVLFLDNQDCREVIHETMGGVMVAHFDLEPYGPYKADVCRVAALDKFGGFYLDTDMGIITPVHNAVPPEVTFSTAVEFGYSTADRAKHGGGFFQSFLASVPSHPVLKENERLFQRYYDQKEVIPSGEWMGPVLLRRAFESWYGGSAPAGVVLTQWEGTSSLSSAFVSAWGVAEASEKGTGESRGAGAEEGEMELRGGEEEEESRLLRLDDPKSPPMLHVSYLMEEKKMWGKFAHRPEAPLREGGPFCDFLLFSPLEDKVLGYSRILGVPHCMPFKKEKKKKLRRWTRHGQSDASPLEPK